MTSQLEIEILSSQRVLYGLLQAQYGYPLSREKLEPFLEIGSENPRLDEGFALVREDLAGVTDWEALVERLNIEYTRLFEGPGQAPVPPYASFYLNDQRLMGPETLAVRRSYIQRGVASVHMGQLPDDHIALELAFISYLSGAASDSLARGEDEQSKSLIGAQVDFLQSHLLTWVPQFCSNILSTTNETFFTGLSKLTLASLNNDVELLGEMSA